MIEILYGSFFKRIAMKQPKKNTLKQIKGNTKAHIILKYSISIFDIVKKKQSYDTDMDFTGLPIF